MAEKDGAIDNQEIVIARRLPVVTMPQIRGQGKDTFEAAKRPVQPSPKRLDLA